MLGQQRRCALVLRACWEVGVSEGIGGIKKKMRIPWWSRPLNAGIHAEVALVVGQVVAEKG